MLILALNSKINFTKGTLGGDVLTAINNANIGVTFYKNSNVPNNRPSGCDCGAYYIIKESSTNASIIYIGRDRIACSYSVDATNDTSITWYVGASIDINGTISNGTNTITVTKTSFVIYVFRGNTGKFYVGFCSDGYITMPSSLRSDDDVSMSISGATLTITSSYQYDLHYRIIAA